MLAGGYAISTPESNHTAWPVRLFRTFTGDVRTAAVSPSPPVPLQPSRTSFTEVSVGRQQRFSPRPERLANPDELIGRKGLRIYGEMQTDDAVKAALTLKKHAVLSTGWDIAPASTQPIDIEAAEFLKYTFEMMQGSIDDVLLSFLSALGWGFSVSERVLQPIKTGPFAGKVGLKAIKTRLPHGFIFVVDAHDNLADDGIEQYGRRLPREKFVVYSYGGEEYGNWYGMSDLRAAYDAFWMKKNVLNWWGIFLDRYGIPLAEGIVPSHGGVPDGTIDDVREALDNLQAATSFVHGDDVKLSFPTSDLAGQGAVAFERAVNISDMRIARALLMPNLLGVSAQGNTGTYAQARTQFDVFLLIIEKLQRDLAETVMGEQVIRPLIDLNYRVDRYPSFIFLPFTESNKAELLQLWLNAINSKAVHPRPEDEAHIRMMTEFPAVPIDELPNPPKPEAVTVLPDESENIDAIVEQVFRERQPEMSCH